MRGRVVRFARFVQVGSDDQLRQEAIRPRCQTIAQPEIYVEAPDLEIDDAVEIVLLFVQRQKPAEWAEIGIVLQPDRKTLSELAGEACGRCEFRVAPAAEADAHDRVDDEFEIAPAPADDRPELRVEPGRGELWCRVAQLDVDAVEQFPLRRVGRYEKLAEFAAVAEKASVLVDRERSVESDFVPVGHTVGQFGRAVQGSIGNEPAGKIRLRTALDRIVQVLLQRPLADLGNLGIVDLNLVDRLRLLRGGKASSEQDEDARAGLHGAVRAATTIPNSNGGDNRPTTCRPGSPHRCSSVRSESSTIRSSSWSAGKPTKLCSTSSLA